MTADQHTLAKYLLELTMVDYEMVHFPPSMVASAALALTLKILDAGEWVSDFMKCFILSILAASVHELLFYFSGLVLT